MLRLKRLLWPFPYPVLTFEYISHRLLRWIITPYLMIIVFFINLVLINQFSLNDRYVWVFLLQVIFYISAIAGWLFEKRSIKIKIFFIPYYFCLMNYAVIAGLIRYVFMEQSVLWEKAKRK
jgi:hypothetical protein